MNYQLLSTYTLSELSDFLKQAIVSGDDELINQLLKAIKFGIHK